MAEKEYIEREALKSKLKNMEATSPNKVYQNAMEDMIYYFIPKIIDEISTADVAPVRHGRWTEKKSSGVGGIWDYYFVCSVCGGSTPNKAYIIAPDFCPNCGAKMVGDKND